MIAHIKAQIYLFEIDPPDTDFQRGYLQALIDLHGRLTKPN